MRMPLGEIEWLDKVQKNFKDDGMEQKADPYMPTNQVYYNADPQETLNYEYLSGDGITQVRAVADRLYIRSVTGQLASLGMTNGNTFVTDSTSWVQVQE
jgi:hypothetical protein